MKKRPRAKISGTARQRAWWASERFREIGRRSCLRINARRRAATKCGATKRSDGQPCQNLPLANGRCRLHGGATPSGKNWHVVQYPKGRTPTARTKFEKKLADRDRLARKLANRLGAMTAAQRARYDAWCRTHRPGPAAGRAAAKFEASNAAAIRALLSAPDEPDQVTAEMQYLQAIIAQVERLISEDERSPAPEEDIFG